MKHRLLVALLLLSGCSSPRFPLDLQGVQLKKFENCAQIYQATQARSSGYGGGGADVASPASNNASETLGETNIQVAGVDELDLAKADGDFIYTLTSSYYNYYGQTTTPKLLVLRRAPAEQAGIIQRINISGFAHGLFITASQLILLESNYDDAALPLQVRFFSRLNDGSLLEVAERKLDSNLLTARLIDSKLHLVTNKWMGYYGDPSLPTTVYGSEKTVLKECDEIFYEPAAARRRDFGPTLNNLTCVLTLDLSELADKPVGECVLTSGNSIVYSSHDNLFMASMGWQTDTPVHQFALAQGDSKTRYIGSGLTKGELLNQFSLDEHAGHLRLATTIYNYDGDLFSSKSNTVNRLEVLRLTGKDLESVGLIDNIAKGERIYATRFIEDKGFIVTFKKVDPLFTVDLSDPTHPVIRGELKIPGYSTYLQPLPSAGHLLGIGKDAEAANESDEFAWYQGIAMSIFDVSDMDHPELAQKIGIGSRGTESPALHDHKAFRYIPEENLVVFSLSLYEGSGGQSDYGNFTFAGFHIYRATIADGFSLLATSPFTQQVNRWWYGGGIERSFYRDGVLALLGGNELVLRATDHLADDLLRIPIQ